MAMNDLMTNEEIREYNGLRKKNKKQPKLIAVEVPYEGWETLGGVTTHYKGIRIEYVEVKE